MIQIQYRWFKGLFIVMCVVFVLELVYFGNKVHECKQYIAMLDIPQGPGELPEDKVLAEDNTLVEEPMQEEPFHIARKRALSIDEILDKRDPFSDVTFRQGAERQRAKELEEFWSQRYYSILREDTKKETDVISFAYIIKERPPLPPPVLDEIEIEGMPKESVISPVKQESPFQWKGTLLANGQTYHFLGNEKKDYAVSSGEKVEGYTLYKDEGSNLLLEKDGEIYAVERRQVQ